MKTLCLLTIALCMLFGENISQRQLNLHTFLWGSSVYFDCGNVNGSYDRIEKPYATDNVIKGVWNHWAFTKTQQLVRMNIYLNGVLWHISSTSKTNIITILNWF